MAKPTHTIDPPNTLRPSRARVRRTLSARATAALLALGAIAGCTSTLQSAGVDVITNVYQVPNYTRRDVSGAPANVYIVNPPGGDAQAVADVLRLPGWFQQKRFRAVPDPGPAFADTALFVLKFDAGAGFSGSGLCSSGGGSAAAGPARSAHVALCNDGELLAEARIASDDLTGPADPGFARALRRLFVQAFPRRLRDDNDNNDSCAPPC